MSNNMIVSFREDNILLVRNSLLQKEPHQTNNINPGFSNKIWNNKALRIICLVSRFLTRLHHSTENIRFKFLTRKVFKDINDQASNFEYYQLKGFVNSQPTFFNKIYYKLIAIFPNIPVQLLVDRYLIVISPDSTCKLLWDIWELFVLVINVFYIPMKLSFDINVNDNVIMEILFDIIPLITFIIEILINFNLQFYKEGRIHTERKAIVQNYIKGKFILDLMVVIPFFIKQVVDVKYLDFVLLLRITKMQMIVKNIEEALDLRETFAPMVDLLKLIYLMIIVSHFSACGWHYLGQIEESYNQTSWLSVYHLIDASKGSRYISSLYWSTVTLLTVGYGDIVPQTEFEKLFIIITSFFTICIFGYTINNIGIILKEMQAKQESFQNKMAKVNHYLKKKNVNKGLQLKIRKYYEHYFKSKEEEEQQGFNQLNELTDDLKIEILRDIYKKVILRSKSLNETLSNECLNNLALIVKDKTYQPEEIIFFKNDVCSKLIFLNSGDIELYQDKLGINEDSRGRVIKKLNNQQTLNEKSFFLSQNYPYSALSKSFTQVSIIDFDDFVSTLKKFPEDYEKFFLMRTNLLYNQYYKGFNTLCEICSTNHSFTNCPFTFYQPKKDKLLAQFKRSKQMKRQSFNRNERKNYNLEEIQDSCLVLIIELNIVPIDQMNELYLEQLGFIEKPQEIIQIEQLQSSNKSKHGSKDFNMPSINEVENDSEIDSKDQFIVNSVIIAGEAEKKEYYKKFYLTGRIKAKDNNDSDEEEIQRNFAQEKIFLSSNKIRSFPLQKSQPSEIDSKNNQMPSSKLQTILLRQISSAKCIVQQNPRNSPRRKRTINLQLSQLGAPVQKSSEQHSKIGFSDYVDQQSKRSIPDPPELSEYKEIILLQEEKLDGFESFRNYVYFYPNENLDQIILRLHQNKEVVREEPRTSAQQKYRQIQDRFKKSQTIRHGSKRSPQMI